MKKPGKAYYMISAVAQKYNIHPQTLRLYEREGLLKPSRTEGNTRLYSEEDLEQLETILSLTRDLGVNLAGVEIILNMRRKIEQMQHEVNEFMEYVKHELARGIDDWEQRLSTALVKSSPTDLVRATPAPTPRRKTRDDEEDTYASEFGCMLSRVEAARVASDRQHARSVPARDREAPAADGRRGARSRLPHPARSRRRRGHAPRRSATSGSSSATRSAIAGCGVPLLDLIHEGNLGLIEAARRFDPSRNVKFITYAVWWVRQAMMHALSDRRAPSRSRRSCSRSRAETCR